MKILYLHQYFTTPEKGGGTRSYEMAKRMVRAGHEVHMITSRNDAEGFSSAWDCEQIEGITVHSLPVPYANNMSYGDRIKAFFRFALAAGNKAVEVGGDLIFATSTPLTIALPAVKVKKKLKVPMVFEVRDLWPELPIAIGALKSPLTKWMAKKLERYAYFNAEHVIGLSPGMSDGVIKTGYPASQVSTVPNSCDINLFQAKGVSGAQIRSEREWLQDRPLVIYAGTLGHINGVSYLADLAAATQKLNPEVRFLVVGTGVEEVKVKEHAEKLGVLGQNFFMEKQIPKKEMPNLLAAATICSSLFVPLKPMWANSANKFFDALAAGRPVAINYGGWQEKLVDTHGIGIVLDPHSAATSAQNLVQFIDSPKQLKVCGEHAAELARESFSRDKLAAELIQQLENVHTKNYKTV